MISNQTYIFKVLIMVTLLLISSLANAERNERHDNFQRHRDIRNFDRHDYAVWRSGRWHQARHGDRLGWWWIVAGAWYFYPEPVYPFPDPYTPPVVVVQPPPANTQTTAPPPAQYWYFCSSSNSYYPYVSSCPEGWQSVPAYPPANSTSAPPVAPTK